MFKINAPDNWLGSAEKSIYKLVYNSGDEYGVIILSDNKFSFNENDYRKFVTYTYNKLAKDPDNINVTLHKVTPYSVLGMKNAPAVVFSAKGKKFFTFAPYVDHHAYSIIAVSWHDKSKILPSYLIDMLGRIAVETTKPKQIVSKFGEPIEVRNKVLPTKKPEHISTTDNSSSLAKPRREKIATSFTTRASSSNNNNTNMCFDRIAPIYKAHFLEIDKLKDQYYTKSAQEKDKIRAIANAKRAKLQAKIAQFISSNPVIGSKIPFKTFGNLPFTVQQVKVSMLNYSRMEFIVKAKINQDIKNTKGEIEQRISIYFGAIGKDNKPIKGTKNWATNHGWVKLLSGTVYDAMGHWNGVRLQNMGNFKYLKIMSKSEYKKR